MNASSIGTRWLPTFAVALLLLVALPARAQTNTAAPAATHPRRLRIGVYDSRAVAVAYANSREFQNSMKPAQADYRQAKLDGNKKHMEELQHRMRVAQRRLNEQAYSTASVAPIMATLQGFFPAVAREAGVDAIVSKWELNYASYNVETEDVTDKLVALLHTTDQGWKWAKDVQQKPPIPIDKYTEQEQND